MRVADLYAGAVILLQELDNGFQFFIFTIDLPCFPGDGKRGVQGQFQFSCLWIVHAGLARIQQLGWNACSLQ